MSKKLWTDYDVGSDLIFADFLTSIQLELNNLLIQVEVDDWMQRQESNNISNKGGWQSSTVIHKGSNIPEEQRDGFIKACPNILKMYDKIVSFTQYHILTRFGMQEEEGSDKWKGPVINPEKTKWWANVNRNYDWNALHNHARADVVGVYYPKCDKNSSYMSLMRNDGSSYSQLYTDLYSVDQDTNTSLHHSTIRIKPEQGRLYIFPGHLWHYVEKRDRIVDDTRRMSFSFNFYIE